MSVKVSFTGNLGNYRWTSQGRLFRVVFRERDGNDRCRPRVLELTDVPAPAGKRR